MANTITNNPSSLAQLLGNPEKQKNSNELTGLEKAQQQANDKAQALLDKVAQDAYLPSSKGLQAAASIEKYQNSYAYSQTMTMSLTTQEGDTVKVDFRQLYAQYQEYQHAQAQQDGPKGVIQLDSKQALESTAFEQKFAFSVEGNLNQDELKAVYDVFGQVDELANKFYNGDIEAALQKSQDLKIDFGQLKNLSLNLQTTETRSTSYQKAAAYQGVQQGSQDDKSAQAGDASKEQGQNGNIADLPPYLQKWQEAIQRLNEQFANAREAFDQLMAGTTAQRFPEQDTKTGWFERIKGFHDMLAEAAKLDKVTLAPSGVEIPVGAAALKPDEAIAQVTQPANNEAESAQEDSTETSEENPKENSN